MTAVIYARYSSDNQREESIEGQIRECTAYAEKNGITIVKHYIDRAISAKTDNRPEFQQMIKDSDKKLFDIVLVWKLDRFARNRYDSARYKTQLKKNGVKLMSATEIISEGPEGIILESVLEGYAEYYSADLAEKVVRGQTENILKGRCNGGRGTFGYTLDSERKFHIDPLTSPFVLESFKKYNEGSTMKEIRDWLNENGIKNPVGGAFTYNSVEHKVLTSSMRIINPGEVCTHSYFVIGAYDDYSHAENTLLYLKTKFVRALILLALTSINLSKLVFPFVPMQDFSKTWTDEELYKKYELTEDEIAFVESTIRVME